MGEVLMSWLGRGGYLPHGYCFTWSPGLLWSMVTADAVIAASYYSIPVALVHFARRRPELQFNWVLWLFSAFIFACGTTHVLSVWTIWQPDYAVESLAKIVTAALSLATAIALWPLIPKALRVPSIAKLQAVIDTLEAEVSRRKTAEEHLQDVQQSLAVTLASIDAGFIATDRSGKVMHMNEVAERVTGWTQREAQGRGLLEVFVAEGQPDAGPDGNAVDMMIRENITLDRVSRPTCRARDGRLTAVETKAALTYTPEGGVRGMAMVFRDMTRLNRAEAESNRLAAIVESSNDAIIGKTLDGRITDWNGAAQDLFGYAPAEIIGRSIETLVPPDRIGEEALILARLAQGERLLPFDTFRLTKEGRSIEVSVNISPIRDGTGAVVGASKIARDITAQRRTEQALRDSEARLRFTLEAAQIGDWELDLATGEAIRRSLRHDRCFGYVELQPAWNVDIFMRHVHPDDAAEVLRGFKESVDRATDWCFECRVVWPDASIHSISGIGRARRESPTQARRMLGIVTDVTQQRQAEAARRLAQALETENRQIVEANRLKSEFLANMSHELRTPMNSIIGFADLLHSGKVKPDSPKYPVFVDHIRSSGRHLLQLINDILDLSKVEAGKFEFFPESIDLASLSAEVVAVLEPQRAAKSIAVSLDVDPGVGPIVTDSQRLKQVLYNYLSNALKFTQPGGSVVVRARPDAPGFWRLEVQDTGMGIRPDQIGQLFSQFQQLDGGLTKSHAGTGLGLALTRKLVEAQGGSVGVSSVVGVGSVFSATLPCDTSEGNQG